MIKKFLLAYLIPALLIANPAMLQLSVQSSGVSYTLEQTFAGTAAGVGYGIGNATNQQYLGGLINPTNTHTITRIEFSLLEVGTTALTLQAQIYNSTGAAPDQKPNTLLATSTNTIAAADVGASFDWVAFNFSGQSITSGTDYHFVLKSSGVDAVNNYQCEYGAFNTTTYETSRSEDGSSWVAQSGGRSLVSRSYVSP